MSIVKWSIPALVRVPLLISWLMSSAMVLYVLANYLQLPPLVPLFYTLPQATQSLVSKEWILILPIFSLSISLFHTIISQYVFKLDHLLAKLFVWITVVLQVLLLMVVGRIIVIIT